MGDKNKATQYPTGPMGHHVLMKLWERGHEKNTIKTIKTTTTPDPFSGNIAPGWPSLPSYPKCLVLLDPAFRATWSLCSRESKWLYIMMKPIVLMLTPNFKVSIWWTLRHLCLDTSTTQTFLKLVKHLRRTQHIPILYFSDKTHFVLLPVHPTINICIKCTWTHVEHTKTIRH